MNEREAENVTRERRTAGMTTLLAGVLLVLIVQFWLINVALEAHLAANHTVAIPTFLASLVCFAVNLGLLKFLYDLDASKE